MDSPVCVVTGVGPGNGAAFSRKFAAEGYAVAMLARSQDALNELEKEIPGARGYPTDLRDAAATEDTFAALRKDLGPVKVLCHNVGSAAFGNFDQVSMEQFETAWQVNTRSLLLCAKQVVPDMRDAGGGAIVVTGATASLRAGAAFAAFASAKAAQRALAQSMARHLGPEGIHVAYVVVDGVIDIPRTREFFKDRPDDFFLKPEAIADTVYQVAHQDRSAWTFEVDLRPFGENW